MPDAVVVGGGLAGACAAIHLARGGAKVTLIERSAGPHDKVCGEFLSNESLAELSALGLDVSEIAAMGAPALSRVRLAARGRAHEAALPFTARSLTRRVLDEALLDGALSAGVTVMRGQAVTRCERQGDEWAATLGDGSAVTASHLVAATGKHDLRGGKRPDGIHGDLVGLKSYFRLSDRAARDLTGCVDVIFFPGGYLGVQPVETGEANACLVVSRDRLASLGGNPWAVFDHVRQSSAHAAALFEDAVPTMTKPLAVGRVPYGYVRTETDGAYHVGDQAAVIPSFCGEGMGLALRSGRLAAEAVLSEKDAAAFQRDFAALASARVKGTAWLSRALAHPTAQAGAATVAHLAPKMISVLAGATRTPAGEDAAERHPVCASRFSRDRMSATRPR